MNNTEEMSLAMMKNMNVEEFIAHITTFESVDSILVTCKNQSEKGFIYERLWDVCIKFGFCNHFQKSDFTHMIGNMNTGNLKPLTTFTHYLTEKVAFFKNEDFLDKEFMISVAEKVKFEIYEQSDVIMYKGVVGDKMYISIQGKFAF